jgi:lipopolysaccharide/colanic/teichoic acid biosynthesis glycosyltransferase
MLVERHRSLWRYYRKHFPRRAFVNLLAWSAIWGRCALVVAQDLVAKPFRSRPGVTASFMRADLERASPELVASVPSHGRPGAAALERAAARIVGSPAKRAFDVLVAGSGLLLSAPLWTLFALAVKLEDGGPVFYSQARVGLGGRAFRAFKFRSMVPDAERAVGAVQAAHGDPRVTRVGRLLRATAMDELPQLWNIFRGDMTFVGPRALRPGEIEANGSGALEPLEDVPGFAERCLVRPGLTGLAQIYASRRLPRRDKFRYDRLYIRRQSFWLDLRLILYSFWISVTGTWEVRGRAYPS